jgi:hypothetical protein
MKIRTLTLACHGLLVALGCAGLLATASAAPGGAAAEVQPLAQVQQGTTTRRAARPTTLPQACTPLKGVERRICVECDSVAMFKRIGCQQRVFWSACKGKRLFEDPYCQAHQDKGPPRGEGG